MKFKMTTTLQRRADEIKCSPLDDGATVCASVEVESSENEQHELIARTLFRVTCEAAGLRVERNSK